MWRLIYAIPTWIFFMVILTILILLGWIVVPFAAWLRAYYLASNRESDQAQILHWDWPWMFLWDNYEDGIGAGKQYWKAPNEFLQIVYWSCLRNPVNNLRIVPWLSCKIVPELVRYVGKIDTGDLEIKLWHDGDDPIAPIDSEEWADIHLFDKKIPQWFFAWQGLYSNFYWQFMLRGKLRRFWIGFKIFPTDIFGVTEYRKLGAGFALQWKVVK